MPEPETVLPLTDIHAPQTLRRKIFLERLDQSYVYVLSNFVHLSKSRL